MRVDSAGWRPSCFDRAPIHMPPIHPPTHSLLDHRPPLVWVGGRSFFFLNPGKENWMRVLLPFLNGQRQRNVRAVVGCSSITTPSSPIYGHLLTRFMTSETGIAKASHFFFAHWPAHPMPARTHSAWKINNWCAVRGGLESFRSSPSLVVSSSSPFFSARLRRA